MGETTPWKIGTKRPMVAHYMFRIHVARTRRATAKAWHDKLLRYQEQLPLQNVEQQC